MFEHVTPLTQREQTALQHLAASMTVSTRRNTFGLSREDLQRVLQISREEDIQVFLGKANRVLAQETIRGKVLYDEVIGRYVYLAQITPRYLLGRFPPRSLYLFMYLYYLQVVCGRRYTALSQLLSIIRSSEAQSPRRQVKSALEPLIDFCLAVEEVDPSSGDEEVYRMTTMGRIFMSGHLLQHATELVMDRNFEPEVVVEFFRINQTMGE